MIRRPARKRSSKLSSSNSSKRRPTSRRRSSRRRRRRSRRRAAATSSRAPRRRTCATRSILAPTRSRTLRRSRRRSSSPRMLRGRKTSIGTLAAHNLTIPRLLPRHRRNKGASREIRRNQSPKPQQPNSKRKVSSSTRVRGRPSRSQSTWETRATSQSWEMSKRQPSSYPKRPWAVLSGSSPLPPKVHALRTSLRGSRNLHLRLPRR